MSDAIIEALRAEREVVLDICARLGEADWQAGSGCPGWSVQDVISHLGAGYWMVVDPAARPAPAGPPGDPVASISSGAGSFLRWVTQRGTLEEAGAEVSGDARQLAAARKFRVF